MMETVAVVGASPKEARYSNMAMRLLMEKGHRAVPVAPAGDKILEQKVYASVSEIPGPVHTVSMYIGSARQDKVIEDVVAAGIPRVIFNPGAENPDVYEKLRTAGIRAIEACTLVLLKTGQF